MKDNKTDTLLPPLYPVAPTFLSGNKRETKNRIVKSQKEITQDFHKLLQSSHSFAKLENIFPAKSRQSKLFFGLGFFVFFFLSVMPIAFFFSVDFFIEKIFAENFSRKTYRRNHDKEKD